MSRRNDNPVSLCPSASGRSLSRREGEMAALWPMWKGRENRHGPARRDTNLAAGATRAPHPMMVSGLGP